MKIDKKFSFNWLVLLVLIIAAFLRLWHLSSNPPSLTPDEASLGYNAYSILKTGKDEYSEVLPIIFKSFGDYKPGLYVYVTVPFVAVMGLSEWSVRMPSVVCGVLAVYLLWIIVQLLVAQMADYENRLTKLNFLPIVAALMLAISPWHIQFSRGAWEVNMSLTLTLLGILFFIKSFQKPWFIVLSSIFFALTLITYQGSKLASAIVLLVLCVAFHKEVLRLIKTSYQKLVIGGVFAFIIATPILFSFTNGQTGRLSVFSIFSYHRPADYLQNILTQGSERVGDANYYLYHSEALNFGRGIMTRWFNHFSGRLLFFEGDWQNPRHTAPYHGVETVADLFLFLCGLVALTRIKNKKYKLLIGLWLILAPLPAVLSRDQVHAVRAYNMVIPLTILLSLGALYLWEKVSLLKINIARTTCYLLFFTCYLFSYIYFLDSYFVHQPIHNASYWQYGYKQMVAAVEPIQDNYREIIVQQSYAQPYIYFLFFDIADGIKKHDPVNYQAYSHLSQNTSDVGLVDQIDNIHFEYFSWPRHADQRILIIGDAVSIPDSVEKDPNYHVISTIKNPDGTVVFRIVEGGLNEETTIY